MAARTDPNLTDKVCCLIILYFGIPYEHAKGMSRKEIMGLVDWDHGPVPVAIAQDLGWLPDRYNHPSNLCPRLTPDHKIKTATQDIPQIAKAERISKEVMEYRQRLLAKAGQAEPPPPKKRFKWGSRKMQSRPMRNPGR